MKKLLHWLSLVLLAELSLLLLAACEQKTEPRQVDVELRWQEGQSLPFRYTSRSGFEFVIDRFAVSNFSVELIPCNPADIQKLMQPSASPQAVFIRQAYAGHPGSTSPARLVVPLVESVGETVTMGSYQVPEMDYCRLHYLVSASNQDGVGLEQQPDMEGKSIQLQGSWRRQGESEFQPLELVSTMAYGKVYSLGLAEGEFRGNGKLVLERSLAEVLEGWQPTETDSRKRERLLLKALIESVAVSVHE